MPVRGALCSGPVILFPPRDIAFFDGTGSPDLQPWIAIYERVSLLRTAFHSPQQAIRDRRMSIASPLKVYRFATKRLKRGANAETSVAALGRPPIFCFNLNILAKFQCSVSTRSPPAAGREQWDAVHIRWYGTIRLANVVLYQKDAPCVWFKSHSYDLTS